MNTYEQQHQVNWEQQADYFYKKYKRQMQMFESSPVASAKRGLDPYDYVALGKELDAFQFHVKIMEANGNVGDLGPLPRIGLDVITANRGISPLPVVAGIQPIPDVIGMVWFKDIYARTTRGNVTTGQKFVSPLEAPDVYAEDYSSDTVLDRTFLTDANGGTAAFTDVAIGITADKPINPHLITIRGSASFNSDNDDVVFPDMVPDPDTGKFSGAKKAGTTVYAVEGTVDFDAATVDLEFSAVPSSAVVMKADFAVLEEAQDDIPSQQLVMSAKLVKARFFALKGTYGFAQAYMSQTRWGTNLESEMTKDLTASVNAEVFNLVLKKIVAAIPAGNNIPWGRQAGSGVSYYEHIMTLPSAVTDAGVLLTKGLGRGSISAFIAGIKACGIMEMHPQFTKTFEADDELGPHVYGTFMGKPVVRVVSDTQLDDNVIVGLWKGRNPFEAPVVWAPYMPLTMTEVMGTGKNPLQKQRAAAIWGGIETIIPNALTKITIDQSSFDYGSA